MYQADVVYEISKKVSMLALELRATLKNGLPAQTPRKSVPFRHLWATKEPDQDRSTPSGG